MQICPAERSARTTRLGKISQNQEASEEIIIEPQLVGFCEAFIASRLVLDDLPFARDTCA